MRSKQQAGARRRQGADLEEIRPHIFLIHDPRVKATIKGEGTINGQRFELTSWRRDGLMARLRDRGFNVRTLADQVEMLPNPPQNAPIGGEIKRSLATRIERFSYFDALALSWVAIEPVEENDRQIVTLRDGWVVRRRKGRGASDYYTVFAERTGGAGLRPIDDSKALLMGYAQATGARERDITAHRTEKHYLLPDILLPPAYKTVLSRIAEHNKDGWRVHERGWPLVQELFAKLGLLLRPIDAPAASRPTPATPPARKQRS